MFGGASVLAIPGASVSVPHANLEFVRTYLAREGLEVAATSVGGSLPRQIRFYTDSGKVLVRRVVTPRAQALIVEEERLEHGERPRFGDVTLFGGGRR